MSATAEKGICNVEGCTRPVNSRGLCAACSFQARNPGSGRHAKCKAAMLPSQRGKRVGSVPRPSPLPRVGPPPKRGKKRLPTAGYQPTPKARGRIVPPPPPRGRQPKANASDADELIAAASETAVGLGLIAVAVPEGLGIIRPVSGEAIVITAGGQIRKGRLVCEGPPDDSMKPEPECVAAVCEFLGELGVKWTHFGTGRLLIRSEVGRMIRLDPAGRPHAARLELEEAK